MINWVKKNRILMITFSLVVIGLVMISSASLPVAIDKHGSMYYYLKRQFLAAVLGTIAMIIVTRIPTNFYYRKSFLLYLFGLILSILPFVPPIGVTYHNASRWIDLYFMTIMPSDYVRITTIIFVAFILSRLKNNEIKTISGSLVLMGIILAPPVFLIIKQPDLSTAIVLSACVLIMFHVAGMKNKHLALSLFGGIAASLYIIIYKSTAYSRISRIAGFLDPIKNKDDSGWQVVQSLSAISLGGIAGVGLGRSTQKYFYLSQAHNDYIFAIICEELGLLGAITIITLFIMLIREGIKISIKATNLFDRYLSIGIVLLIGIQALLNMAVALSLLPSTGLTLPFISYGGSSLIAYMVMVGILLRINKQNNY